MSVKEFKISTGLLTWTREQDGEHNGKPCYDYHAELDSVRYHITWAYDNGGQFGVSAYHDKGGRLTLSQIEWRRSRKNCFARAEEIAAMPRCDHDGTPLAACKGAACRSHGRCCWQ